MSASHRVELRIPSRAEFVSTARLVVSSVACRLDFGIDAIDDLKLAVGEACANAIKHSPADSEITITYELHPAHLIVEVVDHGMGFDPSARPSVDIDELPQSGLGLMVIEAVMDEVCFQSSPEQGTRVRMVKRRPK
jgi:serine/threonine-protein kinase RsbW